MTDKPGLLDALKAIASECQRWRDEQPTTDGASKGWALHLQGISESAIAASPTRDGAEGAGEEEEKTILEFFDNAENADLADETWSLNATDARKALNVILEAALSPSPAVAADPVSLGAAINAGIDAIQAASASVKVDRKAIARDLRDYANWTILSDESRELIEKAARELSSLPVQPAIDKTKFYAALSGHLANDMIDIVWQAVQESGVFAGVQPGAGERDICPYCDSEMEKDACSACGRERVPPEGYARQGPHSSSETES